MMKKLLSIILVSVLLLTMAACGTAATTAATTKAAPATSANATTAATTKAATGPDIKIGQVYPMTGGGVESGTYEKQGAELAIAEINAAGGINGRKLVLVQEDSKSTNAGVVAAFQKIVEDKAVVAVLGRTESTQVTALLPTIKETKIPVAIGGTNIGLTLQGVEWLFRFRPNDGLSAQVMVKYATEELKAKKIAILHSSDAFGAGGKDLLIKALAALNMTAVTIQAYNNDDKDYTGVITALKQSGADCMLTYMTLAPDEGIFAKQRTQQGLTINWVGSASITAVAGRALAGEALYGTFGVADFHVDASAASKKFTAAYNKEPDYYAAWPYDAVYCFAEAMKKAATITPENIKNEMFKITKYEGAEGTYSFDKNGDGLKHYHIVVNDKDVIKMVKTITVQ
jgi:branched-chain amino acid transport system substrate-binding protein